MPGQVRFQLRHPLFVEGGEGFIEDPQGRCVQVQAGQRHAALLAGGKGVTGNVLEATQADVGQGLPDRLAAGRLVQRAEPGEVLLGAEQALDSRGVADPQQAAGQFAALFGERPAVQADFPGGRLHQSGQQAQQAGLAAAVGTHHLQHLTGGQAQVEALEQHAPVALAGEPDGFQQGAGCGDFSRIGHRTTSPSVSPRRGAGGLHGTDPKVGINTAAILVTTRPACLTGAALYTPFPSLRRVV